MATSGSIKGSTYGGGHLWLTFDWSQSSQDIANNKTTISWSVKLHWNARINFSASKSYSVTVNGTKYTGSYTGGASGSSGSKTIKSGSTTIAHNADGTKSFSISATFSIAITYSGSSVSSMSVSGSQTLNTIPRASSVFVSVGTVKPNAGQTINISRASSAFTHTLTYSCNGLTGTIATKTTATSVAWTVPAAFITKAPNANQTCTITCQTFNGATAIGTKTCSFTVGYYGASTISASSGATIGSGMSFTISRQSGLFVHSMWYSFGTKTWQGIGSSLATSASFTPPMSLCSEIPNATSGSMAIILRTYYGSTQIGSDQYKYITVSVPGTVVPAFSGITCVENVAQVTQLIGAYVQNKTRLTVGITGAAGSYGSTIKAYKITVAGNTINAVSGTTNVITVSGNQTITAVITDSRGRTATRTMTVNILPYSPPKISGVGANRDSDTTCIITANLSASSLIVSSVQKNVLGYTIEYKSVDAVSYTSVTGNYETLSEALSKTITGLDASKSYEFRIYAKDIFGNNSACENISISTSFRAFDFDTKSGRVGIQKLLEHADSILEVPAGKKIYSGGNGIDIDNILVFVSE